MTDRSFIGTATTETIRHRLRARAWRTRYGLSDPRYTISLRRVDPDTQQRVDVAGPVEVVVTPATVQPDSPASGAGGVGAFDTGTLDRFGEWDVRKGDTFALDDGTGQGPSGFVTDVPVRIDGRTVANYRMGLSAGQGR